MLITPYVHTRDVKSFIEVESSVGLVADVWHMYMSLAGRPVAEVVQRV